MQRRLTPRGRAAGERAGPEWLRDVVASITLWAVYSSQALAYSRLALATPVAGLVTAVAGALVYALLGSSRRISIGPAGGICAIIGSAVAGVPSQQVPASIAALALMAAGILFVAGLLRLTFLQRLFPEPVFVGYLAGTGVTILIGQVKDLTAHGLLPLLVGLASLVALLVLPRLLPRLPAPFVVIAAATGASAVFQLGRRGVPAIGNALGHFGSFSLPVGLDARAFASLLPAALGIALFLYVDALANAAAFARPDDPEIRPRREYFALGAVNLAAGLLGGFVAGCSTSRTAVAESAGARSRRAPALAGVLLLASALSVLELLAPLPLATLSAVVIVAAVGLVDLRRLRELRQLRAPDFRIALAAAAGVILVGPMWGVGIGVAAALFEALRRAMTPERQMMALGSGERYFQAFEPESLPIIDGMAIYRFGAPLFFGNADVFTADIHRVAHDAGPSLQTLIIDAEALGVPDATAHSALVKARTTLRHQGIHLVFGNVRHELASALSRSGGFTLLDEAEFIAAVRTLRAATRAAQTA